MIKQKNKCKKIKIIAWLVIIVLIIISVGMYLRNNVKNFAQSYAQALVKSRAIEVINDSTTTVLLKNEIYDNYNKFVEIQLGSDNTITYMSLNMLLINLLMCDLANTIQTKMNEFCQNELVVMPMGAIIGSKFFANHGPELKIKIRPIGNVVCNFYNVFENAGINNTRHELYAKIVVDLEIMMPLYTEKQQMNFDFLFYQNVIVGKIPNVYLSSVGKTTSSTLDLLP